jgi:hypothetical protein
VTMLLRITKLLRQLTNPGPAYGTDKNVVGFYAPAGK